MLLLDGSQPVVNTSVNREAVNFTFTGMGLSPGRLYRAVLTVESGGLTAESGCEGATGKAAADSPGGGVRDRSVHLSDLYTFVSVVPAPVLDLHIRHYDETSLSAMWSHAPSGSRDGYFLTLRHGNRLTSLGLSVCWCSDIKPVRCVTGNATVDTREVESHTRECTFNVLTPGRQYVITVTTRSHNLSSSVSVEGRTGPSVL